MARRTSEAQTGTWEGGSSSVSTNDAEVEAVGDNLSKMYLFESSSASDSDARPYSFIVSGTQAVASTDSTVALHPDEKVNMQGGGGAGEVGSGMELGKQHQAVLVGVGRSDFCSAFRLWPVQRCLLDRVSFHGRFVHLHLPSFLPLYTVQGYAGWKDVGSSSNRTDCTRIRGR